MIYRTKNAEPPVDIALVGSNHRDAVDDCGRRCRFSASLNDAEHRVLLNKNKTVVFQSLAAESCERSFKGVKVRSQIPLRRRSNG